MNNKPLENNLPVTVDDLPRMIMTPTEALQRMREFDEFVTTVLREGVDYGYIPGVEKPTLLKAGAEQLCKAYGLVVDPNNGFEILSKIEDWEHGFFHYQIRCRLVHARTGLVMGEGIGSCNSKEDRYRWRDAKRHCPACGKETLFKSKHDGGWFCWAKRGGCGRQFKADDPTIMGQTVGKVENPDPYTLVNTILKMAEVRAYRAAVLTATWSSGRFTQDMEDVEPSVDGRHRAYDPEPSAQTDSQAHDSPEPDEQSPMAKVRQSYRADIARLIRTHMGTEWLNQVPNQIASWFSGKKYDELTDEEVIRWYRDMRNIIEIYQRALAEYTRINPLTKKTRIQHDFDAYLRARAESSAGEPLQADVNQWKQWLNELEQTTIS